jgi:hypothetical protein
MKEELPELVLLLAMLSLLAGAALLCTGRRPKLRRWIMPLTLGVVFGFSAVHDYRRLLPEAVAVRIDAGGQTTVDGAGNLSAAEAAGMLERGAACIPGLSFPAAPIRRCVRRVSWWQKGWSLQSVLQKGFRSASKPSCCCKILKE